MGPNRLSDWHLDTQHGSKRFGEAWQQQKRSLILIVPSVVARHENNILINPDHPEFSKLQTSLHLPVWWDKRLFAP